MDKNFWHNENISDDNQNGNQNQNEPEEMKREAEEIAAPVNENAREEQVIILDAKTDPEEETKATPSSGDSYTWIAPRESRSERQMENSSEYRWNYSDYKNGKKTRRAKTNSSSKVKSSVGLKVFAAAMSLFFVFTAFTSAWLLIQNNDLLKSFEEDTNTVGLNIVSTANGSSDDSSLDLNQGEISDKVLSTEDVISKVKPSVVCVEVETMSTMFGRSYKSTGTGTGFILTADGYIATNNHVIEGAEKITVTLNSGEVYDAKLIGGNSDNDLAVIKIEAKNLPAAELGDSDNLREGEDVVAIGCPGGKEFAGTNTKGIISALNREIEVDSNKNFTTRTLKVIQTDASINPGNSGGPLVNNKGHVIGINTMKIVMDSYEGMGFAIPITEAIPIIQNLINNKDIDNSSSGLVTEVVDTVSIGITGWEVSLEEAAQTGIPQGIKIKSIEEGGPCDGKGIGEGDIIIGYNGQTVTSFSDVRNYKSGAKPGDKATLTIYRNGTTFDVEVILQKAVPTEKEPATSNDFDIPDFFDNIP